jgi:transposase InsO family protein
VHDDEGRRCHRDAGLGTEGLGTRPGKGHLPAKASLRQWLQLHRGYIAADLAKWLDGQNMEHVRGAPYHPMTQGKIERWHQTLKNRILLENYYLPGDTAAATAAHQRESLPACPLLHSGHS